MVKVAINGFGRIGRCVFRAGILNKDIDFIAVNDITDAKTLAHLLKYDSTHGKFVGEIKVKENSIFVNGKETKILSEKNPENLPWDKFNIDIVIESTGLFTDKENASKHLSAGAKKVIITAPAKNPDITIVMGVNEKNYDSEKHNIISNASCTTNCLAPVAKVILKNFGFKKGFMTTVHSYTTDQRLLDAPHKDLRRARSSCLSMIPTTTGAAIATSLVIPELKGKLDGIAIRIPTPNVSLVDLVAETEKETNIEEVNSALKKSANEELKGILDCCEEPLVSVDFNSTSYSGVVDLLSTNVIQGNLVKVLAWYDNEMGYSHRVIDLASYIAKKRI